MRNHIVLSISFEIIYYLLVIIFFFYGKYERLVYLLLNGLYMCFFYDEDWNRRPNAFKSHVTGNRRWRDTQLLARVVAMMEIQKTQNTYNILHLHIIL